MQIYCTGCGVVVEARLTDGEEMYPKREDLETTPFWVCDKCGAFVGTHHKTNNRYLPLGYLATPEVKKYRKAIHALLDPLWLSGKAKRGRLYEEIGTKLGRNYHTAEIYSVEDGKTIYGIVKEIADRLDPKRGPWNR